MGRIIALENVGMRWDGKTVLSGVGLSVNEGDFIAMTGPNGGGKTTLLRIILKLLRPTSGVVSYYDAKGDVVDNLAIGYLPQKNMIDARFPITVEEVVASGLLAKKGVTKEERNAMVERTIALIELESHAKAAIGELSGGQLQRALLGRAIISSPEMLVLDEPLSYLDKHFEEHIYRILATLASSTTILLVSHEMSVISKMANRHLIVDRQLHECKASHHYIPSPCC